jgi:hypothetical protein
VHAGHAGQDGRWDEPALDSLGPDAAQVLFQGFSFRRCFIQENVPENSYAFPNFVENSINIRKMQNIFC